jgi:hypothetical protein
MILKMHIVGFAVFLYILGIEAFSVRDEVFVGFEQSICDHNVSVKSQFPDISISSFLSGWEHDTWDRLVARQFQCTLAGYSKYFQPPSFSVN